VGYRLDGKKIVVRLTNGVKLLKAKLKCIKSQPRPNTLAENRHSQKVHLSEDGKTLNLLMSVSNVEEKWVYYGADAVPAMLPTVKSPAGYGSQA
jgi:hypothetical protein